VDVSIERSSFASTTADEATASAAFPNTTMTGTYRRNYGCSPSGTLWR
jgi:hypothetical protein